MYVLCDKAWRSARVLRVWAPGDELPGGESFIEVKLSSGGITHCITEQDEIKTKL